MIAVGKSMNESKSPKSKVDLSQYKYRVNYTCNNPAYGDDFLFRANEIGAIKVISNEMNPKTGRPFAGKSIFYAIKDKGDYDKLKSNAKDLPGIQVGSMAEINWDNYPTVYVDDYEKGSYAVKSNRKR